jgi:hypothetical protein
LVFYGVWQVAVTLSLRVQMVNYPTTGGYGVPLLYTRDAARAALSLAPEGEVVVLSNAARPFLTETPTVFDALLFGVPHRFAEGASALPIPESAAIAYLVGPIDGNVARSGTSPLEAGLRRLLSGGMLATGPAVTMPDGATYRTYAWTSAGRDELISGMTPLAQGIPFANNVVFAAFDAPRSVFGGESTTVWLAWWLRSAPPGDTAYHFTVQLLGSSGELIAQDDHAGYPTAMWRTGDLVLSRFVLEVPAEAAGSQGRLRAGMYTYPEIAPVVAVSPAGEPIDDGVTLVDEVEIE